MDITRYNYGNLLPSEDEIIAQGRDFGEHEKSCDEVTNILFPVIDELRKQVAELEVRLGDVTQAYQEKLNDANEQLEEKQIQVQVLKDTLEFIVHTEPTLVIPPRPNMEVPTDFKQFTTTHVLAAKRALNTTPNPDEWVKRSELEEVYRDLDEVYYVVQLTA